VPAVIEEPVEPLTIVRARAIGGLRMTDDKAYDRGER
jgi:inorganic pyrophosphatase